MSQPTETPALTLVRNRGEYWVYRFDSIGTELVTHLGQLDRSEFWSLTSTADEVSVVSPRLTGHQATAEEGPWALFHVAGTLDFSLTGILNALTNPLTRVGVSVFAISTFDTDYLMVTSSQAADAEDAWRSAGVTVT